EDFPDDLGLNSHEDKHALGTTPPFAVAVGRSAVVFPEQGFSPHAPADRFTLDPTFAVSLHMADRAHDERKLTASEYLRVQDAVELDVALDRPEHDLDQTACVLPVT